MKDHLLDKLMLYTSSDAYPLHMPGHKRQISYFEHPFAIDITEIDGFDNLHHPEGILLEAQERAARLYGADETFYLINGSTCGILAAVSASVRRGGRVLMARNSHKAAFHAALINGLRADWLYPETDMCRGIYGSIRPDQVREALAKKYPGHTGNSLCRTRNGIPTDDSIQAVFITSPTYDGVVSDIRAIAEEAHRAGAILIVDEAHGAHFAMHSYFPQSALECGADIVINSLHKTMPSLTQTALLHVKGNRVDRDRLRKYLGVYQSSSPSYVLMASIDECVQMMETQRTELFERFVQRLKKLRSHLGGMRALHLVSGNEPGISAFGFDPSKILISTENCPACVLPGQNAAKREADGRSALTGPELGQILRGRYRLEVEMEAEHYVTAIMTVADTQEGFDRLERALLEIDAQLSGMMRSESPGDTGTDAGCDMCSPETNVGTDRSKRSGQEELVFPQPVAVMTMAEADGYLREPVLLEQSLGRIAAEPIYLYPPGVPLLVPGEQIPDELPGLLTRYQRFGLKIQGMADYSARTIQCVSEKNLC
ncbi:MAG: PLP-dependent transferase [Lachnospiraceae bacterium]|nr:PLP-dependent transferase [Lachnospiraceae bacterium]